MTLDSIKLFVLLYADDTVILGETAEEKHWLIPKILCTLEAQS